MCDPKMEQDVTFCSLTPELVTNHTVYKHITEWLWLIHNFPLEVALDPWERGRIEISWNFRKRFRRIEFTKKVLEIQGNELYHVKLDKITYFEFICFFL